ncbi:MAG: RNA polymerase factor sigma-54 [Parachlamydiaceae bacterium]
MTYSQALHQRQKQQQKLTQHLMMSHEMQQAIELLQAPVLELSLKIEREMENNPVLEYMEEEGEVAEEEKKDEFSEMEFDESKLEILSHLDEEFRDHFAESENYVPKRSKDDDKLKAYLESSIEQKVSLGDHLLEQVKMEGFDQKEQQIAEVLIGYLDEQGYLSTPLSEISASFSFSLESLEAVLKKVQALDPPGVASRNLREVLLSQLARKGKQNGLAYKIIEECFDDLIHNRLPQIQKRLKASIEEIRKTIDDDISHLDLHPCSHYDEVEAATLVPDATLTLEGEVLEITVNEGDLQPLRFNRKYLRMLNDPEVAQETKNFIKTKILSAQWLLRNISQRNETLFKIVELIAQVQRQFFLSPEGKLKPMTMKAVAQELSLHESTIARAVSNKAVDSPRGIFPLRFFFTNAYVDSKGEDISSKTVKQWLSQLVEEEDKKKPLSDEALSQLIQRRGIQCARRTVAKYRRELSIPTAQQRRSY